MLQNLFFKSLEQGLVFGIMALGVYITFKILKFSDLTVDGSFPLGAAVAASLIVSGHSPFLLQQLHFGRNICRINNGSFKYKSRNQ